MKLVFSSRAERDLDEIAAWIARDDADVAARFVAELTTKAREIAAMPLAFPLVEPLHDRGIRKRTIRGYAVLYRISRDTVRIDRIVNARRDYLALLR